MQYVVYMVEEEDRSPPKVQLYGILQENYSYI